MKTIAGCVLAMGMVLVGPGSARAEQLAPRFGVDSVSTFILTAWDLEPSFSTVEYAEAEGGRYLINGGSMVGGLLVPQGARLLALELEGCDTVLGHHVHVTLSRLTGGSGVTIATASSGVAASPGCSLFTDELANPETVDNVANRYVLRVSTTSGNETTLFRAVRVYYQLQVSPPPDVASFNDVPTSDPAFQFIEALAASGITAGCGSGDYCPDAPLTRRQMAVFLAKALGLFWADGPGF